MRNKIIILGLVLMGIILVAGCGKVAKQTSDDPIFDSNYQMQIANYSAPTTENLILTVPDIYWDYGQFITVTNATLLNYVGSVSNGYTIATEATIEFYLTRPSMVSAINILTDAGQYAYYTTYNIYVVNGTSSPVLVYHGEQTTSNTKYGTGTTVTFNPVMGNRMQIKVLGTKNRCHFLVNGVYGEAVVTGNAPAFGVNGVQTSNTVTSAWLGAYILEQGAPTCNLTANLYWAKAGSPLLNIGSTSRIGDGMVEFNSTLVPLTALNSLSSETTYNYKFEIVDKEGRSTSKNGTIRTGTNPPQLGTGGVQKQNGDNWAWIGAYVSEPGDSDVVLTGKLYWGTTTANKVLISTVTRNNEGMVEFNSALKPIASLNNLIAGTTYYYTTEFIDDDGQKIVNTGTLFTTTSPPAFGAKGVETVPGGTSAWIGAYVFEPNDPTAVLFAALYWGTTSANKTKISGDTRTGDGMVEFNTLSLPLYELNNLKGETTYYYTVEVTDDDGQKVSRTGTLTTASPPVFDYGLPNMANNDSSASLSVSVSEPGDPTANITGKLYWGTTTANKTLVSTLTRTAGVFEFNSLAKPIVALNNLATNTMYYYTVVFIDDDGQQISNAGTAFTTTYFPEFTPTGITKAFGSTWAWVGVYAKEPYDPTAVLTGRLYWGTSATNKTLISTVTRTGDGMIEFNTATTPLAALNALKTGTAYYYTVEVTDDDGQKVSGTGSLTTTSDPPVFGANGITNSCGSTWAWVGAYANEPNDPTAVLTGRLYWGTTAANKVLLSTVTRTGAGMIEFNNATAPLAALNALNSETPYYYTVEVTDDDGQKVSGTGSLTTKTEPPAFGANGVQITFGPTWAYVGAYVLEPADASYVMTGRFYFGTNSASLPLLATKTRTNAGMLEFNNTGSPIPQLNALVSKTKYYYRYEITDDDGQTASLSGSFTTL